MVSSHCGRQCSVPCFQNENSGSQLVESFIEVVPSELKVELVVCTCKHFDSAIKSEGEVQMSEALISKGGVIFIGAERGSPLALVELQD